MDSSMNSAGSVNAILLSRVKCILLANKDDEKKCDAFQTT